MNDYNDVDLKEWTLAQIARTSKAFSAEHIFIKVSIVNKEVINGFLKSKNSM